METASKLSRLNGEDATVLQRIEVNEEKALIEFYDRYSPILYTMLMRMLKSVEDTDDVVHEIFLQVWNKPASCKKSTLSVYTWLVARARNRALAKIYSMGFKKQVYQSSGNLIPLFSTTSFSYPTLTSIPNGLIETLIQVLKQLSEDERQVLTLAFYEGCKQSEIARRLNIPSWTVKWSLGRSLKAIRSVLEQEKPHVEGHGKKYFDMCAAHVLEILEGNDLQEFESHLKTGCAICVKEISLFTEAAALLPLCLQPISFSPDLKERILFSARLAQVVRSNAETNVKKPIEQAVVQDIVLPTQKNKSKRLPLGMAIALLLVLVGFGVYIHYLLKTLDEQRELGITQQTLISKIAEELERKDSLLNVIHSRRVEIIMMEGTKLNPIGSGKIIWDQETNSALFQVSRLPVIGDDKIYQVWALRGQTASNVGSFSIKKEDDEYFFKLQLPNFIDKKLIDAFGITMELKKRPLQPSGEIYLIGKIPKN